MRRFGTGLRTRLLAFNVLLVFLPTSGMLFLGTYERQLLEEQERSMVNQARVLAASLASQGELRADRARDSLRLLGGRTDTRLRVVDPDGAVLADSATLGPSRERDPAGDDVRTSLIEGALYRIVAFPIRLVRQLLRSPTPPHSSADEYAAGGPLLGPEVRAALSGRYGAATRISSGGQRSVTLYSAIPIRHAGAISGAVLVSQSTYRILQLLYAVRVDLLKVLLASLAAAALLSWLLSRTIAAPLESLRDQALRLVDGGGRLEGRFQTPRRRDEIGDLAEALETMRTRLARHVRSLETFSADISHEFKNPLSSIRAASELLSEPRSARVGGGRFRASDEDPAGRSAASRDRAQRARLVELIQKEVLRLERLLTGLREIGVIDAGEEQGHSEDVDLGELLEGLHEAHRLRGGGEVELRVPDLSIRCAGRSERLGQVFENLLENAESFRGDEPVGIELAIDGSRGRRPFAVVRVVDRGPGIPSEHHERIFERFFSYRPEADPDCDGGRHTGLGLAIARAIVESVGGEIRAWNRPDGGACFEVRLPAILSASSASAGPGRRQDFAA